MRNSFILSERLLPRRAACLTETRSLVSEREAALSAGRAALFSGRFMLMFGHLGVARGQTKDQY